MKTLRVRQVADRLQKHPATIFRWIKLGLDIYSEDSIQQFSLSKKHRRNAPPSTADEPQETEQVDLNSIELAPVGKRGAAAALQRLEEIEERAHARLMRAIEAGNPFQVKAAQEFYLRASETLRRLDAAIEIERRNALEQIPLRQIEAVAYQLAEWQRCAFLEFLNVEAPSLMAKTDLGEFRFLAIERFRSILHTVVKSSIKTNSPIPDWAAATVVEAWNVPNL